MLLLCARCRYGGVVLAASYEMAISRMALQAHVKRGDAVILCVRRVTADMSGACDVVVVERQC